MSDSAVPRLYVGLDWAVEKSDVCAMEVDGGVVEERTFSNSGEGLSKLCEWLRSTAGGDSHAAWIALESPRGAVVETLLAGGFRVHCINPKQLDRFRDRFTVAGAKDDRLDARVLADSLRTDRRTFRLLEPESADVVHLREWARMTEDLRAEKVALCNRLRDLLQRYFPQILKLTDDLSDSWFLALLERVPTPEAARGRCQPAIARILKKHRIRRIQAEEVVLKLREPSVIVSAATVRAATDHIALLSERLQLVKDQLKVCERRLDELIAAFGESAGEEAEGAEGQACEQRDVRILRTFPGVGRIVTATLLAEASVLLAARDYQGLRALCGIAPITKRSGKARTVHRRYACNQRLANAVHHWARVAAQRDPHWKARYARLRAKGASHGRACRGLADRLLSVLMAMLRTGTAYDPAQLSTSRAT